MRKRGLNFAIVPLQLASITPQNRATFFASISHDRATIGPRSSINRGRNGATTPARSGARLADLIPRKRGHDRGSIAPRSRFDRTAIAVRSRRDRGSIARFFLVVSAPSDDDPPIVIANNRGRLMHLKPLI